MKKIIITICLFVLMKTTYGQSNTGSNAMQQLQLGLANVITIEYIGSAPTVTLPFSSMSDYANGVVSSTQDFKVQSNKKFKVSVKSNSSKFSYSGTATTNPNMPISTLFISVIANNTGGTVPNKFDNQFSKMKNSGQSIINNGLAGDNQTFSIQYKADLDYGYPAGVYTATIVYTATQI